MGVIQHCVPRAEVLQGDLPDALFAADFGSVVEGSAAPVYQDAHTFFRNTYPTRHLTQMVGRVFGQLRDASEPGAVIRLSTGFGGGKTHALITLWHLAHHLRDTSEFTTRLLPMANRPAHVRVVGIDAQKAGSAVFRKHPDAETHSLFGELVYQLGGATALRDHQSLDDPEQQPDESTLRQLLPDEPVLILIDELVMYLSILSERGGNNLLALLTKLASVVSNRPRTVLVITDPADQNAYAEQTGRLIDALRAARLDEILSRRATDYDPIGEESAAIIATRLFESINPAAAQEVSAHYRSYYERAHADDPTLIPQEAVRNEYAQRIVACYPFHPRLIFTAEARLGALPDFQRSRGVLRLFARLVRDLWERREDVELITAGEIDWSSDRIRQDLIQRLNRQQFEAAIKADIELHARDLDGGARGVHTRVASALLLDSLPLDAQSGLDAPELTLAAARLSDAPTDPKEAMERLSAIGWYTYPRESGVGWRFRVEPNLNRIIEERAENIPAEDARQHVLNLLQEKWRTGAFFETHFFPRTPSDVPDNARLKLVICDSVEMARAVCQYERGQELPRRFINAIVALAPDAESLQRAIARARRLLAAQQVQREQQTARERRTPDQQAQARQLNDALMRLRREVQLETLRAFRIVVLHTGELGAMEDAYLVQAEGIETYQPQAKLRQFLEDKNRLYKANEALDPDRLVQLLSGATPTTDDPSVYTARSLHERLLSASQLKLIPDEAFVRRTLQKAVETGRIVLRSGARVYDAQGALEERDGRRQRLEEPLRHFTLDDQTLLTPADSSTAHDWTHLDAPTTDAMKPELPEPKPPVTYPTLDGAYSVADAVALARERRVRTIRLTARQPEQIDRLTQAAQQLNPQRVSVNLSLGGSTSDGAKLQLTILDAPSLNHAALKPLERARELRRALHTLDTFLIELELDAPEADYCADRLASLQDTLQGLEFYAAFEPSREA